MKLKSTPPVEFFDRHMHFSFNVKTLFPYEFTFFQLTGIPFAIILCRSVQASALLCTTIIIYGLDQSIIRSTCLVSSLRLWAQAIGYTGLHN